MHFCDFFPGGATRSADKMESTDKNLLPSLGEFYKKQIEVDVCLHSQDEADVWCHFIVAAANSPYIKQCIDDDPMYRDDYDTWTIELRDVNINVLSKIVDYFYTGTLTITAADVTELLLGATILQIDCLVDRIYNIVHKMLCVDNYIIFLKFSKQYKLDELQKVCHKFMLDALPELIASNAIATVPSVHLLSFAKEYTSRKESKEIIAIALQKWFVKNYGQISTENILYLMKLHKFEHCIIVKKEEFFDDMARKVTLRLEQFLQRNVSINMTDEKMDNNPLHHSQV